MIRKYLKKNNNPEPITLIEKEFGVVNRSNPERLKSKRKDGKGGRLDEAGSIRQINDWLNKNGEYKTSQQGIFFDCRAL